MIDAKAIWKNKWKSNFPDANQNPEILIDSENKYEEWVLSLTSLWKSRVNLAWITEVANKLKVPIFSKHTADLKSKRGYVILVNEILTKIEILRHEVIFKNVIWIVNLDFLKEEGYELYPYYYLNDLSFMFSSKENYLEFYQKKLDKIPITIKRALISGRNSTNKYHKAKMEQVIENLQTSEVRINQHMLNFKSGLVDVERYFNENWDSCLSFPFNFIGAKNFQYTASPLILEINKKVYVRKFIKDDITYPGAPYLKKVELSDIIEWMN